MPSGGRRNGPGLVRAVASTALLVVAGCGYVVPREPAVAPAVAPTEAPVAVATDGRGERPTRPPGPTPSPSTAGPPPVATGRLPEIPSVALQAAIVRFLGSTSTPGISATIRWPDGRTWTGTAGYSNVGLRTPVTADTAFAVASMSKTFTAALILELVDQGLLGLDDPAARYLPSHLLPAGSVDPRITIRMLLDHTSGLFDVFLNPKIDPALQSKPAARWTAARALSYGGKAYFAPGVGWHYSNTNYLLLGLIAERVTGRDLGSELEHRFLGPLGLDRTWVQASGQPRATVAHGYDVGGPRAARTVRDLADGTGVAPFTSVITALGAAGAVASTSVDLATWAADLYGGKVVSPAMLAAMTDDQQRTRDYIPGVLYGLGVQVFQVGPWTTLGHSGRLLGFRGQMRFVPATGVSIAVLTNQSRADVAPLVSALLRIVLPPAGGPQAGRR
ncbi:MAG TPA: serine hydrolase domain-containing protein [Candidatus Limnocylindrales bacterium]|nr:serine hydrolase domain-containing protein [Candidatus Limnocylindrales bacterium]